MLSGPAEIVAPTSVDLTFWELARTLMNRSEAALSQRTPLRRHLECDSFHDLATGQGPAVVDFAESGGIGPVLNLTHLGSYGHPSRVGKLTLTGVFGFSATHGGPTYHLRLGHLGGRFCYSATITDLTIGRLNRGRFFREVVALMESCHLAPTNTMTLTRYLREPSDDSRYQ
jgi:hypothetical protein